MAKKLCLEAKNQTKTLPERMLAQKKVLIFASGNGSNFEAIVKYFNSKVFCAGHNLKPALNKEENPVIFELITDKKDAPVVKRAEKLNIPHHYVSFDNLYKFLKPRKDEFDLFVLAGYMRILPEKVLKLGAAVDFLGRKQNKFINIHPSLLPEYKGKNAIHRAFGSGAEKTGVTIHFVEKKVDSGKIIVQKTVPTAGKTLEELEFAIHRAEHQIYPEIIENLLFKKNVLLFGGGAREHAIAQKLLESPFLDTLYLANSNDGFKHLGKTIDFTDFQDLAKKACAKNIDLLVIGPENPLFDGISDIFQKKGIGVIGADKKWAALESSKSFAKIFMTKNGIKTADYKVLDDTADGKKIKETIEYFKTKTGQIPVIKADGPALGKGVSLPDTVKEAKIEAARLLAAKFGESSKKILIEEKLAGREISIISLWDGKTLVSFPPARDYKRLLDNNKGKNTGGMGAIAPIEISKKEYAELDKYLKTLKTALAKEKADFKGIIYSGLISTKDGIYVLEYNMRFGDPETQVLLELLETDLLYIFIKMQEKKLDEIEIKFNKKKACCVVLASNGYPDSPKKGAVIKNLKTVEKCACKIYFAGVKSAPDNNFEKTESTKNLITNGGRVLNIVKSASNKNYTLKKIYKAAHGITFDGKIYRKDIGKS